jgi:lysozyme
MKYSREDFIEKLIKHEGLRLEVYKDSLGIDTIGIGRNLEDRGITPAELDWMDIPNMASCSHYGYH